MKLGDWIQHQPAVKCGWVMANTVSYCSKLSGGSPSTIWTSSSAWNIQLALSGNRRVGAFESPCPLWTETGVQRPVRILPARMLCYLPERWHMADRWDSLLQNDPGRANNAAMSSPGWVILWKPAHRRRLHVHPAGGCLTAKSPSDPVTPRELISLRRAAPAAVFGVKC